LSGRGLCDELITRPEESYRLCCVVVCDLETSRMGAPYINDISRLRVNTKTAQVCKVKKINSVQNRQVFPQFGAQVSRQSSETAHINTHTEIRNIYFYNTFLSCTNSMLGRDSSVSIGGR